MPLSVSEISTAPVQGFRLLSRQRISLTARGIEDDRRFLLVDEAGVRLRSSTTSWPVTVCARFDPQRESLRMGFGDGRTFIGDTRNTGRMIWPNVHGRAIEGQLIADAEWNEALAGLAGHPVFLCKTLAPGDYHQGSVTILSRGSLAEFERHVGHPVDARRFRMTFLLDGCEPHAEDSWEGRLIELGSAILRVGSQVPRCAVTTRHPETGAPDLNALAILARYRARDPEGRIPFGVYAHVEEPGVINLGDTARVL